MLNLLVENQPFIFIGLEEIKNKLHVNKVSHSRTVLLIQSTLTINVLISKSLICSYVIYQNIMFTTQQAHNVIIRC